MEFLKIAILIFAVLGALDRIFGNKFGIGRDFEKGFMLLGNMALCMMGMLVLSPLLGRFLTPASTFLANALHMEPSVIPASLFANDMGGAPLSVQLASNQEMGMFNALVVSSMMGCVVSFTLPTALETVKKERHKPLTFGLLCGVAAIPLGCLVAGLVCRLPLLSLLLNLLPLALFAALIVVGLLLFPRACLKVFNCVAFLIKALITVGLVLGVAEFLLKKELLPDLAPIEEAGLVCINAAVTLSGMFPLVSILARLLRRPIRLLGRAIGVNETSAFGFVTTLVTNLTTFVSMEKMDDKGVMMNGAFAVSAAFVLGSHLAFTIAFDESYLLSVTIGKIVAGVASVVLSYFLYPRLCKTKEKSKVECQ